MYNLCDRCIFRPTVPLGIEKQVKCNVYLKIIFLSVKLKLIFLNDQLEYAYNTSDLVMYSRDAAFKSADLA